MIKYFVKIIKRLLFAFFILYGLNVMLAGLDFYFPINFITLGSITLLGAPGLLGLIVMLFVI